jgi:hypothetical protein
VLALAQLVEMLGQSLIADGFGGPVEGQELIKIRLLLCRPRPLGAVASVMGTIGSRARRSHRCHCAPVLARGAGSGPVGQNDRQRDRLIVWTGG